MRYGVTARRKRNVRRVGELQALRQKRRDLGTAAAPLKLAATEADMSGKLVAVASNHEEAVLQHGTFEAVTKKAA